MFEEFYQIGNPERDRARGLGLGLAIVKRLTTLLGCPLTLRSVPGKGSVFKLGLPLSHSPLADEAVSSEPVPLSPSPGLILVIDDEVAIQDAMRSLLGEWGHEVIVAGSCAQMLERVANRAQRPDLIICDYRLRGAENGIEVIERLQSEYNHDIPAMLVTGDTGPERLQEAQQSGHLLLHKPVARGKLRAAIGNLMSAGVQNDAETLIRVCAVRARTPQLQQIGLPRRAGRLRAVHHVQRLEDGGDVRLDGLVGQAQATADLLVRLALAQQAQHLQLALGE